MCKMKPGVLVLLSPLCVSAWMPSSAPAHGPLHQAFKRGRTATSSLRAVSNDDIYGADERAIIEAARASLEATYNSYEGFRLDDSELDETDRLWDEEDEEDEILIDESVRISTAAVYRGDWFDGAVFPVCGDECEQCEIPEDYKSLTDMPSVDVMAFLGIRRAEPLRVERDWD